MSVEFQINGKWHDGTAAIPALQPRMTREEFRQIRLTLGLTRQALADRLGVARMHIVSIEGNAVGISLTVEAHMRTLLKVHREYRENMVRGKWR